MREAIQARMHRHDESPLQSEVWQHLGEYSRKPLLFPAWQCQWDPALGGVDSFTIFGALAAEQHMATNSYFSARLSLKERTVFCDEMPAAARRGEFERDAAYLFTPAFHAELEDVAAKSLACQPVDGYMLCVPRAAEASVVQR